MTADEVTLKVGRMLASLGLNARVTETGYRIPHGSTLVDVDIVAQEERTLISVNAPILLQLPQSPELWRWVAIQGQAYYFGHARLLVPDGGDALLIFEHTLLGDYLDKEELKSAVYAVALEADKLDDQLQEQFGGKRVDDL